MAAKVCRVPKLDGRSKKKNNPKMKGTKVVKKRTGMYGKRNAIPIAGKTHYEKGQESGMLKRGGRLCGCVCQVVELVGSKPKNHLND